MPTFAMKRGTKCWRGQIKQNGRIVASKWFGSTKKDQRQAILWEEETRKELKRNKGNQKTRMASLTIHEWATAYLNESKRRFVRKTYLEKRDTYKRLFRNLPPNTAVEEITPGTALAHLQHEYDERSGYAANKDRKNLASAWSWGRKYLSLFPEKANPFLAVEKFPEKRKPRYVPPEDDFWTVLEHASGQDRVMLMAFLHLGARRGEIFRLKWQDVDFPKGTVCLATRKTKDGSWKRSFIPMSDELRKELVWWYGARPYPKAEHVFVMLDNSNSPNHTPGGPYKYRQKFMKQKCKKAGVPHFGFHAIRHLSATILYKAGKSVSTIQQILRHANPTTTEIYLKSLGFNLNEMRDAVEVFNNRGPAKVTDFAIQKASRAATLKA